ncbi:SatD family protein [Protaetiibacter mangrovi]|uniref:SatD family protein n=1 Tax=Protaetiibacter mangrovi TaxID=2970926 RepID=A0ABT1ZFA4_9MICO|nr:SatD family protein [Protaetiibacter mangrovi]MCS0499377.1 SatD family protein [Protaetiibacter mangrovi]TPW98248.1 hypothetical protein FJ656_33790 [Schumannella luteola]
MALNTVAIIADIVRSREIGSRDAAQLILEEAFRRVRDLVDLEEPFRPTVGDEFQAVAGDLGDAIWVTMAARLTFPAGVECRFGLGRGDTHLVTSSERDGIRDGSAWWRAREAIETAHREQSNGRSSLRTSFASDDISETNGVNAYLTIRDHVISRMKKQERSIAFGRMSGATQSAIARAHEVSQSAVSQSLQRSGGAALIDSATLWKGRPVG